MILFISENQGNDKAMKWFAGQASRGGEAVGFVSQSEAPSPSRWALAMCERTPEELSGFQIFKDSMTPPAFRKNRYGASREETEDLGPQWYAHYCRKFESDIYENDLTGIVTWGSGVMGNRAAVLAAQDMGISVTVMEDGWFPYPDSARSFSLAPGRAYYELEEWPAFWEETWANHEFDERRALEYVNWWGQHRVTKYTGTQKHDVLGQMEDIDLPAAWHNGETGTGHAVWFGQVAGDAALYWLVDDEGKAKLEADAEAGEAWYKGHPFSRDMGEGAGLRRLPAAANIHQVFERTDTAMILTSNVGLEAWVKGLAVRIYGQPFYKRIIEETGDDAQAKLRALDAIVYGLQIHQHDKDALVAAIKVCGPKKAES